MPVWIIPDKKIIEIINNIENAYDVNSLQILGFNYWPIIRLEIRDQLINQRPFSFDCETNLNTVKNNKQSDFPRIISKVFDFSYRGIKKSVNSIKETWEFEHYLGEISKDTVDCMFLTLDIDHHEIVNKKKYSAEFDPIIEKIPESIKPMKMMFGKGNYIDPNYFFPVTILNSQQFSLTNTLKRYYYRSKIWDNIHLDEIRHIIEEKSDGRVTIKKDKIITTIASLLVYRDLFVHIFQKIKPKTVFLSTYYNEMWMGAILAARNNNIQTVDIQHGWQGKIHYAYSGWTKTPQEGYALLPEYFWVWSDFFKQIYDEWIPKKCNAHKVVIGGHIWLDKWQNSRKFKESYQDIKNFPALSHYKKAILVTTEYTDPPLLPHLIEAIKKTDADWIWLVRLHPNLRCHIGDFKLFFNSQRIKNVELDIANTYPLYILLENVDHHVSYMSTTSFEASIFLKPTTLIHEIAATNFKEFIKAGIFTYADNSGDLINSIISPTQKFDLAKKILNPSSEQSEAALKEIFNGRV